MSSHQRPCCEEAQASDGGEAMERDPHVAVT